MFYETLKQTIEMIEYLKSLSPEKLDDLDEIVDVYDTDDETYCDFNYSERNCDVVIEGSFYRDYCGNISLSPSFTVLDSERNVIFEIE